MKSKKRSLLWAVILFLVFAVASPASMTQVQAKKAVKAKSVTLNRKNVTLEKGKKLKLKATVKPKKATQKKIVWSSGNKKVATVSSKGVVKAKKKGTAKITAKIKGTKKKAVCKVKVKEPAKKPANNNNNNNNSNNSNNNNSNNNNNNNTPETPAVKPVTQVTLNKTELELYFTSAPEQLTAEVFPADATNKAVTWKSSDETVAKVSDTGLVTPGTKEGTAVITVRTVNGGFEASCKVTISDGIQVISIQELLDLLKGDKIYKVIHLKLDEKTEVPVNAPENAEKWEDTVFQIDAPKATVKNYLKFGQVKILRIAADTYEEHAENKILVQAPESHIVIEEGAKADIQIDAKAKEAQIDNNGEISSLAVDTEGRISLQGTSNQEKIPVLLNEAAIISTTKRLEVTANKKASLILKAGSEGTEVNTESEENIPSVSGLGTITANIKSGDAIDEKTIVADKTIEDVGAVKISALKGTVADSQGEVLGGVKVYLTAYRKDFNIGDFAPTDAVKSAATDADGNYVLGNVEAGNYYLVLRKGGYYDTVQICTLNNIEGEVTNERHILRSKSEAVESGSVSGKIVDSVNGSEISNLTVRIREGQNNLTGEEATDSVLTDENGNYRIENLTPGVYTIQVVDLRGESVKYISASFNVYIESGKESTNKGTGLSPVIASEQVRFVLTWGNEESGAPSDLDSHLIGPKVDQGQFHTYYSNDVYEENGEKYADLDLDDTEWEGPETTTIYQKTSGVYYFMIHNFSDKDDTESNTLAGSQAKVEVYSGNRLINTFHVPNQEGTLWNVCSYDSVSGMVTPINEMSYESDADSVGEKLIYGDLKLTGIRTNDFVKKAEIAGNQITLSVPSKDSEYLQQHLNDIIPQIKLFGATYRTEWDEDNDEYYLTISDGKGLQRQYRIGFKIDYGRKYVNGLATDENLRDYDIYEYDSEAYIDLRLKKVDLSLEELKKLIKPELEEGVTFEIVDGEKYDYEYAMILTDTADGSTRVYGLYLMHDRSAFQIENIYSYDERVSHTEFSDALYEITIYGTADSLEDIKDCFEIEVGEDVEENTGIIWDEERGNYVITIKGGGDQQTYNVYYRFDYGKLRIEDIGSKDADIIWLSYMEYDTIHLCTQDRPLSEELFNQYLEVYFDEDTITGRLQKQEDGSYVYVITDSETGKSRTYAIDTSIQYSDEFEIDYIEDTKGDLYNYSIYSNSVDLYGRKENWSEVQENLIFHFGAVVKSSRFVTDEEGNITLELTNEYGAVRTYQIYYDYGEE